MRTLIQETALAMRGLGREPGVTLLGAMTLALALGANAAIFAMVDALVLRPFPFPGVDRLVMLSETSPLQAFDRESVSPANYLDWRAQNDVLERMAAYEWSEVNLVGRDEPERILGFTASADFFPLLGIEPARGRFFVPGDETFGRHHSVILGHGLWMRRFVGDPAVIGQSVLLDGTPHEVVGVAPEGFDFPMGAELWRPLAFDATTAARRDNRYLTVIGRLAPGRTLQEAAAAMSVIGARLEREHPDTNRERGIAVRTFTRGAMDEGVPPIMTLWQASAIFVLLIACANIANLLLARGTARRREIAVRLALGASLARVVRQMMLESLALALLAVPGALAVAWVSLELTRGYMPARIIRFVPGWDRMDLDGRLFVFTVGLACMTAVVFGLVPALQAARPQLTETLREGGRSSTAGRGRQRLRRGLVVAQVALALPLLVAAGLSLAGTWRSLNGPQGYDPDQLLVLRLGLPAVKYPDADSQRRFTSALVDRLGALPGAVGSAATNVLPSAGNNWTSRITVEGQPPPDPARPHVVDYRTVSPAYFQVIGIPIKRGRGFTGADRADTQPVAIVSESMAARYWPGGDALGRRFQSSRSSGEWLTVVGISGDIINDWFGRRNYPTMYRPYGQAPASEMGLIVRTRGEPTAIASAARAAVLTIDPAQPVFDVMSMRRLLYERTIGVQYVGAVMSWFGALALLLAAVGVYSLMAYLVTQRTHEIGVRMALGASRRDVLRLTIGQAWRLTALGVTVGLVLALFVTRLMESNLFGIIAFDVWMFVGFAAVLIAAALAAGYIPARRATAIDPMAALRTE